MTLRFGDEVSNICADAENPMWHCYFVRHLNKMIECTDKKGSFFVIGRDSIYPGHLPISECGKLFKTVWKKRFRA